MPKIVKCPKCADMHWEDRRCPTCFRESGKIERGKAIEDAVNLGAGFLRVTVDGGYERLDPKDVMLRKPDDKGEGS